MNNLNYSNDDLTEFSIDEIISDELVITHFQPLVSLKKKQIIGLEALSRGFIKETGQILSPKLLIAEAEKFGLMLELDRLFRKKAIERFSPIYKKNNNIFLSLNIDNSAIEIGSGSNNLLKTVTKHDIDPGNIIIEILESSVSDTAKLTDFVGKYREYGFLIAIDDFGCGHSNWERMMQIRPDLIKLDISIINNIDTDFYRQESARSIINLSHNTGALVIAEGVETRDEAIKCMSLNADIFQGYFFSKPVEADEILKNFFDNRLDETFSTLNNTLSSSLVTKKEKLKSLKTIIDKIIEVIKSTESYSFNDALPGILNKFTDIECIYILDNKGIQISNTVFDESKVKKGKSKLFYPDSQYTDQSNKDYYFNLINENDCYISDAYISLATGKMSITISRTYYDIYGEKKILCIDISEDSLNSVSI